MSLCGSQYNVTWVQRYLGNTLRMLISLSKELYLVTFHYFSANGYYSNYSDYKTRIFDCDTLVGYFLKHCH